VFAICCCVEMVRAFAVGLALVPVASRIVQLATFDGVKETTLPFVAVNDPVMGGQSKSTFNIESNVGIFDGEVKVVTFLGSPGFCNLEAPGFRGKAINFPDISGTDGVSIEMTQTLAKGLTNWDVSIQTKATTKASATRGAGWQADFDFKAGQSTYFVPYSSFHCGSRGRKLSDCGTLTEQLDGLTQIGIGSSGVAGPFHVELTSISAVSAKIAEVDEPSFKLATFDGTKETSLSWKLLLDPVMGGASTGDYSISADGTALFNGTCNIVQSLAAPGFAKIEGKASDKLVDITSADSIVMKVRSSTPEYQGFKIAFGAPGVPSNTRFQRQGSYKTEFNLGKSLGWQVVEVPLSHFSRDTSDFTGRCDTQDPDRRGQSGKQHYCCKDSGLEPSNSEVCVESKYLSGINDLQVWAEGVEGDFQLEIEWIGAKKSSVVV